MEKRPECDLTFKVKDERLRKLSKEELDMLLASIAELLQDFLGDVEEPPEG